MWLRADSGIKAWGWWLMKESAWTSCVCLEPRKPNRIPELHQREYGQQIRGDSAPLLLGDLTWDAAFSPPKKKTGTCWHKSRQGPQRWSGSWSTSPMRMGWESCGCSLGEEKVAWSLVANFQYLKGACREARKGLIVRKSSSRTRKKWVQNERGNLG